MQQKPWSLGTVRTGVKKNLSHKKIIKTTCTLFLQVYNKVLWEIIAHKKKLSEAVFQTLGKWDITKPEEISRENAGSQILRWVNHRKK